MAELTSTGDWTGLATDLTPYEDDQRPAPLSVKLAAADLQNPPPEIAAMFRLFQDGFGSLLGRDRRLDFSVTVRIVQLFCQAYLSGGLPRPGDR